MSQPFFVDLAALVSGDTISVDASDQIADLVAVPTTSLPTGVANGTYINFASGRVVAVRGTVAQTAQGLGITGTAFSGMARVSTAGAFLTKSPFFTGWVAARTGAGVYTLTGPASVNYPAGTISINATCETAALYGVGALTTPGASPVITIRTYDATGAATDALFDVLVVTGLS